MVKLNFTGTRNTNRDISDVYKISVFFKVSTVPITLTFTQGHNNRYAFKLNNSTYYILAQYFALAINNIRDIQDFII